MRVRALVGFSGPLGSYMSGQEFDLPEDTDWLKAGLVEEVGETEQSNGKAGKKQADEQQLRDA